MTLTKAFAESVHDLVELPDQLALDDHLLTRHLEIEVLVHHLSNRFCDKRAHLGLAHELVNYVKDDRSLLEAQLLEDAVVLSDRAIEHVLLVNLVAIHRFVIFGSALEVIPQAEGEKLACA